MFQSNRSRPNQPRIIAVLTMLILLIGLIWLVMANFSGNFDAPFTGTAERLSAQVETPTAESSNASDSLNGDLSTADVAELANPAVVTIANLQETAPPFDRGSAEPQVVSAGSGFIFDASGLVLTNAHVVEGAERLSVQLSDGTTVPATLLGSDPFQDVAVLQLDLSGGVDLPGVLTLGSSDSVRAGETVVAIGTALGEYANTVTSGTINGVGRSLDTGLGYQSPNLIQHDAELWSGNSGGPLLNLDGEVIGMNVAAITAASQGGAGGQIGFAIEIDAVLDSVEQLIASGEVTRPFLGIEGETATSGYVVTALVAGSPAEEAGVQVGDLITAVDGQEVNSTTPLLNLLFEHQPGDTIPLTVERGGVTRTIAVTLGERPADTA